MDDVVIADDEENQIEDDEQHEDEQATDDDENSGVEENLALLEQPVILTGQRSRKSIERLQLEEAPHNTGKKLPVQQFGTGLPLGEIDKIAQCIERIKSDNLKPLHRILYGRPGATLQVKRNIRAFDGYGFAKGTTEYDRRVVALKKLPVSGLKEICKVLCVPSSGSKEELVEKILDFLLKPSKEGAIGRSLVKKRTKSGQAKTSKNSSAKGEKRKRTKKTAKQGDNVVKESDSEDDDEDEVSTSRQQPKESKKSGSPRKKSGSPSKVVAKKPVSVKKKSESSRKPSKSASKKKTKAAANNTDDESDDEPLVKKMKVEPSDEELSEVIEGLLKDANLEEVTMNKLCEQVYDAYPGIDLQPRRPFIKEMAKKVLGLLS
ncbi:protein DEK-like [Corticium candelabrum]|uniref:protein DEK-like n=1 Tax=Corticium candelabrum TaxID=121492 RepID=UPI002E25B7F9|nr:protein DEK-like [Corticium candelabrum]